MQVKFAVRYIIHKIKHENINIVGRIEYEYVIIEYDDANNFKKVIKLGKVDNIIDLYDVVFAAKDSGAIYDHTILKNAIYWKDVFKKLFNSIQNLISKCPLI